MTWLMVAFGILALVSMVLFNPASNVVDRVLVKQQPWRIEAVDAPTQRHVDMVCGTNIQLQVLGGSQDMDQPFAQSSNPSIASVTYQDNGLWLHAHQKGKVWVTVQMDSHASKPLASLTVESMETKTATLTMDDQNIAPGTQDVYLPTKTISQWLRYQWQGFAHRPLLGIATKDAQHITLGSKELLLDANSQSIGYNPVDSAPVVTCKILQHAYDLRPTAAQQGRMNVSMEVVPAVDYFIKVTQQESSIKLNLQLQTVQGDALLAQKEVTRPTEIRWRQGQDDFSAWTRPYEKDKPLVYVVIQTMDQHNRWQASMVLHPRICNKAETLILQIRHRNFSNRSLSLRDSLWLPAYECSLPTSHVKPMAIESQWLEV